MLNFMTNTKNMISSYDTNVTHHFEVLLNRGFQKRSTIEWE